MSMNFEYIVLETETFFINFVYRLKIICTLREKNNNKNKNTVAQPNGNKRTFCHMQTTLSKPVSPPGLATFYRGD